MQRMSILAKNGTIAATNFDKINTGDTLQADDITALQDAIARLQKYRANVDNCGNCNFCQKGISCQRCQSCQRNCHRKSNGCSGCR